MDNHGIISFELDTIQILADEDVLAVDVTIIRSDGSDGTVTVDYQTVESSAQAGLDFTPVTGTATFEEGETRQVVRIPILEDDLAEGREIFSLTVDNPTGGASLSAPRTASIVIEDNDFIPGAEIFNGNQYILTSELFWEDAQAEATRLGGNLVTINGDQEEQWLRDTFGSAERFWIGLNDSETEGQFEWVSGQPVTYLNWAPGEPNDFEGAQDFGVINFGSEGEWDDDAGTNVFRGIIEIGGANPTVSDGGEETNGAEPIRTEVITGLTFPTAIDWSTDGETIFVAEKAGIIKVFVDGELRDTPALDITSRVNVFQDRGISDIAVHPDFLTGSPYIYVAYAYDPPEVFDNVGNDLAGPDGSGNRASRVGRFTVDLETLTIDPDSEEVILGRNSTWENFNAFVDSSIDLEEPPAIGVINQTPDFLPLDSITHSTGSLEFGPDGALYVSNGDGTSFNVADSRGLRVQDIDTLSGKILRVDPLTGEGLEDNPFYDGDPDSNRSRVYQYGFRNPFRFSIDPETGTVYTGDVGWFSWEEINVGEPGANFGWPFYEGGNGINVRTPDYQNLPEAIAFYDSDQDDVTIPLIALNHDVDNVNAIIGGPIYRGTTFPEEFQGDLFFNDLAEGTIRNVSFDEEGNVTDVDEFVNDTNFVVQLLQGPDDNLYFVELFSGTVGRWEFEEIQPLDNPPEVINEIADIIVSENSPNEIVDFSNVFFDSDGDEITFSIQDNSNPDLVSAVLDETSLSSLNLNFLDDQFGTADITVRATANGEFVDETFTVSVAEANDTLPEVINEIINIAVLENSADEIIDLSNVFFDADGDEILLSLQDNSNPDLVSAVLNNESLTLDFLDDQFGTADITVRATANGEFVDETFTVSVAEANDTLPEVINEIINIAVLENSADEIIDLSNVFFDADGDEILLSLQDNSNPDLAITVVEGENLIIDFLDEQFGTTDITVRATANGEFVDETFTVSVTERAEGEDVIELFRFRNTTFETGTYVFVGKDERDAILDNSDFNQTFTLDGVQEDGSIIPAFTASTVGGEDLIPFFRLESLNPNTPGTFLFASTEEYDAIFAEGSDQADQWSQQGLDENGNDIPEFYLFDGVADRGTEFNRFQNTLNNTFLYAGPEESADIAGDPNFSSTFTNQGVAFRSLV